MQLALTALPFQLSSLAPVCSAVSAATEPMQLANFDSLFRALL